MTASTPPIRLPPAIARVVELRATGMTAKEIGVLLGKSEYTVYEQLRHARERTHGAVGSAQLGKPPSLSPAQRDEVLSVERVRRSLPTARQLARRYSVSIATIYRVIRNPVFKKDACPVYRARVGITSEAGAKEGG
jgi:transposase